MPASFTHRRADVFVPLQRKLDPATRGSHFLVTYARLKPGVTLERAAAEMRALGQTLAREFGNNHGIDVQSYLEATVGNIADAAAGAARRGVLRAADRLRQRRQPAARVGPGAAARAGDPPRARRRRQRISRAS